MCDDNDSGYKSTYANERTIDEKRSLRGRELAHELERRGSGLIDLGWRASTQLDHAGWPHTWVVSLRGGQIWWLARGKGERKMKERKREKRGEKGKNMGRRRVREEKKVWGWFGFSSFEIRIYSVFDFSEKISFLDRFKMNFDF